MTHGTLMIDFAAEPRVLRDWDDLFPAESFIELVITVRVTPPVILSLRLIRPQWPGLEEWRISMVHLVEGRDYISRAELAQFVMDQFNLFTNVRIALFQHLANTDLPGPVISDHGCKRVAKSRMEAWRSPQCL